MTDFNNYQWTAFEVGGLNGRIKSPVVLDEEQLDTWWRGVLDINERVASKEPIAKVWQFYLPRQHLVLDAEFDDSEQLQRLLNAGDDDPRPWPALAWQVIAATQQAIDDATQRPTLPAPSMHT